MDMCFQGLRLQDRFSKVSGLEFSSLVQTLRYTSARFALNLQQMECYENMDCWHNREMSRGFAVTACGQLVNVFSASSVGDNGRGILDFAKSRYPSLRINCYAGRLEALYRDNGFEEISRAANWMGAPNPDVVFMQWQR